MGRTGRNLLILLHLLYSVNSLVVVIVGFTLIDSIFNVNSTSYTISGINQADNFYISTAAGCDGNTERYSDTISNIYLDYFSFISDQKKISQK